jgi:hypothetical protein
MYALSVDAINRDNGLWQDLCTANGGACASASPTWAHRVDAGAMEVGSGSTVLPQGDYNLTLAATPSATGTTLFAGTADLYRCDVAAGGSTCALRNTTNALNGCNAPARVAASQHALAVIPAGGSGSAGPLVFVGNDGGLWRSTDGVAETGAPCSTSDAAHFDNLNGALGSLAEVVGLAQDPGNADILLAGLGALGTAGTSSAAGSWSALAGWAQLAAGEGGFPAIDATQPMNWYVATGAGVSLKQCTLGAACAATNFAGTATVGFAQVGNDAALVDAPTLLDPQATANVLVGTCRVWRGPAGTGSTWSASNAIGKTFGANTTVCGSSNGYIRSLGAGGPLVASGNAQNSGSTG